MNSLARIQSDSSSRIAGYRAAATLAVQKGIGGGFRSSGTPMDATVPQYGGLGSDLGFGYREAQLHAEQYRYGKRDWQYVAVRTIATRAAGQEIRVGYGSRTGIDTSNSYEPSKFRWWEQQSLSAGSKPSWIKALAEDITLAEEHPIIDAFENPNPIMERWHLIWNTMASLQITGKSFWWLYTINDQVTVWPLPSSWVRRDDSRGLQSGWIVQPAGSTEKYPVLNADMCYFYYPDPEDPTSALSPLQSQARSVTLDEKLQISQTASYDNGPKPSMLLRAGYMPDFQTGGKSDRRWTLTPEQRSDLITAIKLAYSGAHNHGEPLIVDGLIEDAEPWMLNPAEMDYMDSELAKKKRIMQGFGVNPSAAGEIENVSYASSAMGDHTLCSNVVNPTLEMIGQVMTRRMRPRYQGGKDRRRLYVWVDPCQPFDPERARQEMDMAASYGSVTDNEIREFIGLKKMAGGDIPIWKRQQSAPPSVGTQGAGRASSPAGRRASA